MTPTSIGLLLFPRLTQLDLTGPFEVFAKMPGASVHLLWKSGEPVAAETGMRILPDTTLAECPPLDVLCVPGGPGVSAMMEDAEVLAFLREQAGRVRILLGAFGAIPTKGRVVRDGNLITGGGVTAGIDFALTVVAELAGRATAQGIQLQIEYAPAPPFDAGTPETAPPDVLSATHQRGARMRAEREVLVARIARGIGAGS